MECPKCGSEMTHVDPCYECGRPFSYWFCLKCMHVIKD